MDTSSLERTVPGGRLDSYNAAGSLWPALLGMHQVSPDTSKEANPGWRTDACHACPERRTIHALLFNKYVTGFASSLSRHLHICAKP